MLRTKITYFVYPSNLVRYCIIGLYTTEPDILKGSPREIMSLVDEIEPFVKDSFFVIEYIRHLDQNFIKKCTSFKEISIRVERF